MSILNELKMLESFDTIDDIKKGYTIESLKELSYKISLLNKENDKLFDKYIEREYLEKERIKSVWLMKSNLQTFKALILKAIVLLEREDLINKTITITDKLNNVVSQIKS